jgi:hypothetical protein
MQKSNVQEMQELSPQEIMGVSGAGNNGDYMSDSYPSNYPEGQVTTGATPPDDDWLPPH